MSLKGIDNVKVSVSNLSIQEMLFYYSPDVFLSGRLMVVAAAPNAKGAHAFVTQRQQPAMSRILCEEREDGVQLRFGSRAPFFVPWAPPAAATLFGPPSTLPVPRSRGDCGSPSNAPLECLTASLSASWVLIRCRQTPALRCRIM